MSALPVCLGMLSRWIVSALNPLLTKKKNALSKDFPLFLVSNCQSWYLRSFWNQFKVEQYFKGQDCYGDSGDSKAEMIKGNLNKHFLKHPIYIGETEGDQQASHEAGVVFGYASYGFGEASNPQVSFTSVDKLVSWFLT